MGLCCVKAEVDLKPEAKDPSVGGSKSPSRNPKQTEVNPFKPGNRSIRIVQNEDGKLEKTVFKHSDLPAADSGEALSLVTHSLLTAQKADQQKRISKPP